MATKYQTVTMVNSKGHTVSGEFVCETSNAWQVAVGGKVQLLMKDEWTSRANAPFDFGGLFG